MLPTLTSPKFNLNQPKCKLSIREYVSISGMENIPAVIPAVAYHNDEI